MRILTVSHTQPFRDEYPVNPSWEIAKGLPEYLPPSRAKDPSSRDSTSSASARAVRIMVHPEAVPVSYVGVRALVPTLWGDEDDDEDDASSRSSADVAVHIGMASARPTYGIERLAHRTGYKSPDVDGRLLEDEDADGGHGPGWVWRGLPDELHTDLDMPDVLARWRKLSPVSGKTQISLPLPPTTTLRLTQRDVLCAVRQRGQKGHADTKC